MFQPGNKFAKGGKRKNAGRPPKNHQEIKKAAAAIARDYIEASVKPVMQTYFQLAHGRLVNKWHEGQIVGQDFEADAATTRHFIDKLLPDEQTNQPPASVTINFVRFDNTLQVSAAGVPTSFLADHANGHEPGGAGLASPGGQGQNGIKFHNFEDVS